MSFNFAQYASSNGQYVKFKEIGDSVQGVILDITEGTDYGNNPVPQLVLEVEDGTQRIVTASQANLRTVLADVNPQVGEEVRITLDGFGISQPGKSPAKLFTVEVFD